MLGLVGSDAYMELFREERARLDRLLRLDPLRLRRLVPRAIRQSLYDRLLAALPTGRDPRAETIGAGDFELRSDQLEGSLDVCAVCRSPLVQARTGA